MKKILIAGGSGFIGSHVVRQFVLNYPQYHIYNLDTLINGDIAVIEQTPNYSFVQGNVTDESFVNALFEQHRFEGVLNVSVESPIDLSIADPFAFVKTNLLGTKVLLQAFKNLWSTNWEGRRFYQIGTDEIYGSLNKKASLSETTTSKYCSDHYVRTYGETHNMPYVISNCSNNYGPNQYSEKLIPKCIYHLLNDIPFPIYGDGKLNRDWLFVEDHVKAIDLVFHQGKDQQTYNVGGFNEWTNIDLVKLLCQIVDQKLGKAIGSSERLISYVSDRPKYDLRYTIDARKINSELGWKPAVTLEQGLSETIDWFMNNQEWFENYNSLDRLLKV